MVKHPAIWHRLALGFLVSTIVLATALPAAAAVGTAFTYQGRIAESGTAVTGVVDLEFELYDDPTSGSSVGGPIALSDVNCSDGLFTVTLDFGAAPFNGQQLWMEIRVSSDYPTDPYTVLTPRQELTPDPYAIFATNAANASYAEDSNLLDGIDSTGFALVGHTHAAGTITGVADGLVVYGSGGGTALTGEAGFTYDEALNDLSVANDIDAGGVYRIGTNAVLRVMPAADNTFAGLSGNAAVSGTANSALGDGALVAATTGGDNTAVGSNALAAATIESSNTAVGANALAANSRAVADPAYFGTGNTAMGAGAMALNTKGFANVALGAASLAKNTEGYFNTAVGAQALANVTATGSGQTAVGFNALGQSTTAVDNTAVGTNALAANQIGNANTALGVNALAKATVSDNVAVGDTALGNTTTGNRNSALGSKALFANVTGADNTAVGALALVSNTTAGQNTAFGASALGAQVTGGSNTAVGAYALDASTSGINNTALGSNALTASSGATSNNTAVGAGALAATTTGGGNTAVGLDAGRFVTTGTGNVFVGASAGSALNGAESNDIMIGHPGNVGVSNMIRIGDNAVHTDTRIAGINGIAIAGPATSVIINANGQLGTSIASSKRYKEAIRTMGADAGQLLRLRPVVFLYREGIAPAGQPRTEQYGLIAEEVAAVNPDWVIRDVNGNIVGVRYDQVNAALLGLVQQQQATIDALQSQMSDLADRLARLEGEGDR